AQSAHNSYQLNPHFGAAYGFEFLPGTLEPFLSLDLSFNFEQKFKEHGAGTLNMQQKGHTASMLRTEAGLNGYTTYEFIRGIFIARMKLSYVNKQAMHTGHLTTAIVGAG